MQVEGIVSGRTVVVRLVGRMDATTAPRFEDACGQWVEQGVTNIVVDLNRLEYISSAGLRSILTAGKRCSAQQGKLVLCGLHGMVREVVSLSGFDTIFPVCENPDAALETL